MKIIFNEYIPTANVNVLKISHKFISNSKNTCEASEKFGPGDRFLVGADGVLFVAALDCDPLRFLLLLVGL